MPAKDIYHENFKNALIKDGWTITHDPIRLFWGSRDMYVDLAAEKFFAAEKAGKKIAVEIKSFLGSSEINDLENALGQYLVYRSVISRAEPERTLYLAVHKEVYNNIFEQPLGDMLLEDYKIQLVVYDISPEVILRWIP
uniref:XisH protein n=1 Tax=Candidatus Kentrum sp. UNK TaxID=2126344 RepID=A0A451B1V7_9GAMM|nr:MAG: XisH protein [Candidatus Kentron sp. UNK]VFK72254.1 MAG: XisH protein [Candidatus Kentron sp. UNK]